MNAQAFEKQIRNLKTTLWVTVFILLSVIISIVYLGKDKIDELTLANQENLERLFKETAMTFPELKCRKLEVVDEANNTRIRFLAEGDSIWQYYYDKNQLERIGTGLHPDGAAKIRLYDHKSHPRWVATATRSDGKNPFYGCGTFKEGKVNQLIMGAGGDNNSPYLAIYDNNKKFRVGMGINSKTNTAYTELLDTKKQKLIFHADDKNIQQAFYDQDENYRIAVGINSESNLAYTEWVDNNKQKLIFHAGDRNIQQTFYDQEKNYRIGIGINSESDAAYTEWVDSKEQKLVFHAGENNLQQVFYDQEKNYRLGVGINSENNIAYTELLNNKKQKLSFIGGENNLQQSFVDQYGNYRLGQGLASNGDIYFELIRKGNQTNFSLVTQHDGRFKNYIYQSPGQRAWNTTSDIGTGLTLFQFLFGKKR